MLQWKVYLSQLLAKLVALSLENLLVAGCQRLENTLSSGGVGASSAHFHRASPRDILFISELGRQHVTGRGAWHRDARSPCPPAGVAGCEGC